MVTTIGKDVSFAGVQEEFSTNTENAPFLQKAKWQKMHDPKWCMYEPKPSCNYSKHVNLCQSRCNQLLPPYHTISLYHSVSLILVPPRPNLKMTWTKDCVLGIVLCLPGILSHYNSLLKWPVVGSNPYHVIIPINFLRTGEAIYVNKRTNFWF